MMTQYDRILDPVMMTRLLVGTYYRSVDQTAHVLSPIVKVVMETSVLSQQLSVWQTELISPS